MVVIAAFVPLPNMDGGMPAISVVIGIPVGTIKPINYLFSE
jgi:hypothetical protein